LFFHVHFKRIHDRKLSYLIIAFRNNDVSTFELFNCIDDGNAILHVPSSNVNVQEKLVYHMADNTSNDKRTLESINSMYNETFLATTIALDKMVLLVSFSNDSEKQRLVHHATYKS